MCVCVCVQVYAPATGHVASFSITLSKINKLRSVLAEHTLPQVRHSLAAKRHASGLWTATSAETLLILPPLLTAVLAGMFGQAARDAAVVAPGLPPRNQAEAGQVAYARFHPPGHARRH